ncbi:MAG: PAS domain S-box protein [Myxococcales bacterium]|nr:PAS domain S-box protein [Myxococcales bacterium]
MNSNTLQLPFDRDFFDQVNDAIIVTDAAFRIVFWNKAMERIFGISRADAEGRSAQELLRSLNPTQPPPQVADAIDRTGFWRGQTSYSVRQGERIWIDWSVTRLPLPERNQFAIFAIARDITEQRQLVDNYATARDQYRLLFNEMMNGFMLMQAIQNEQGEIVDLLMLDANPPFYKAISIPREQFVGKTMYELIGDRAVLWMQKANLVRQTGKPERFEYHAVVFGSYVEINLFSPQADQFAAIVMDVTEKRQAYIELQKNQTFLLNVINHLPSAIFVKDAPTGQFVLVNRANETLIGRPRQELMGKTDYDFFSREQADFFRQKDWEAFEKGEAIEIVDEPIDSLTLGRRYLHTIKVPIFDAEHRPQFIMGIADDITEHKAIEEALRQSETRYRTLFHSMPEAVIMLSREGHILDCNLATSHITRLPREHLIGARFQDLGLYRTEDLDAMQHLLATILAERKGPALILEIRTPDGERRWVEHHIVPLLTNNEVKAYQVLARDITEAKKAEAERERLQQQFLQSQKMEAVGRLAGGVAHDFNNLLTGIHGYAEIALKSLHGSDPLRLEIEEIQRAAERASFLTQQLLAFSRKQMINPQPLDLNELIGHSIRMLERVIGEDVRLIFEPGDLQGSVKADAHQLDQILINLAVNARDAMPNGGRLTIATAPLTLSEEECHANPEARPGRFILLTVRDTGTGMSPEVMEHLFEPFFTTKSKDKGTGLGLATIYGIVKQNQGWILVESAPGAGTAFHLYFPWSPETPAQLTAEPVNAAPHGWETILLVEDESLVRGLAKKVLTLHGYQILEAADGGSAYLLAKQRTDPIHLLLTDVIMPEMNGRDLYQNLQDLKPEMKVLFMSGYPEDMIGEHGVLDEKIPFINKPFSLQSLVRKVRDVLDGTATPPAD